MIFNDDFKAKYIVENGFYRFIGNSQFVDGLDLLNNDLYYISNVSLDCMFCDLKRCVDITIGYQERPSNTTNMLYSSKDAFFKDWEKLQ